MSPATFAPTTVRSRKIEKGTSGSAVRLSQTTNAARTTNAVAKSAMVSSDPQPLLFACVPVHERDEPAGDKHGTGQIEGLDPCVAALRQEKRREREAEQADRHVDEEDPLPAQRVRKDTAEQDSRDRAERADAAPGAERGVSLLPFGEGRGQDRERGRSDQRRTEPLETARADQRALAPRETGEERGSGEHDQSDDEDPSPPDQVGDASAEQEEAAEEERVGAHDPLEILLREPEVALDGRKGDVHDRDVEHDHELHAQEERESEPLPSSRCDHGFVLSVV